jgi:hypothetical protein
MSLVQWRGLHGRNHAQGLEARDVRGREDLGVLDPETVPRPAPGAERGLVGVQDHAVGGVADGMGGDLEALGQRALQDRAQGLRRDRGQAACAGLVGVRLEQQRAAGSERAVRHDLDRADGEAAVPQADLRGQRGRGGQESRRPSA